MKVKISADSTCDLPKALIEKYDIGIMPLYIIRAGESLKDGEEITTPEVFDYTARTGELCGTAAVTIMDYVNAWTEWKKEYDAIVHVSLSSELSASYSNACIAAQEVGDVWVVDSRNLSTGTGHLVLDAGEMAEKGMDAADIAKALESLLTKLDVSFVLDTLIYLRKGGRCSALAALGANLLSLKPCIEVRDGTMDVGKKYRGKLDKAFLQYITDRLKDRDDIDTRRIFITDSGISEEMRAVLKETVLSCQPFEQVYFSRSGCVISGHCGPWCMGILYYHK
ncbi:MAG TPA: DegV family protein [Clostridiales bacterium]|jgi:DegV family protein with EDD domain|nr:DegV family protein [Clostridiales bacterium]